MDVRKQIGSPVQVSSASSVTQNSWTVSGVRLRYQLYEDATDPLNDMVMRFTLEASVKNASTSTRTFPSTSYPARASVTVRKGSQTSDTTLFNFIISIDDASVSFSGNQTKSFTATQDVKVSRSDVPTISRNLWIWLANQTGSYAQLTARSGYELTNIPSKKQRLENSDYRVTFTSGGTTYDILNMY